MAQLIDICSDMVRQAERTGSAVRTLARGLELKYEQGKRVMLFEDAPEGERPIAPLPSRRVRWWRVTLSRPAVHPSEEEVAICRACFGVPDDAERRDDHNQVVLEWTE